MSDPDQAPAAPATAPAPSPTDAAIERWFADHFSNSIISRSEDTYAHVRAAVDDLKQRLGSIR